MRRIKCHNGKTEAMVASSQSDSKQKSNLNIVQEFQGSVQMGHRNMEGTERE